MILSLFFCHHYNISHRLRVNESVIIASNDYFGSGTDNMPRNVSVYVSHDNGNNWQFLSWVLNQYWSNLFTFGNNIYILGTNSDGCCASVMISQSTNNGVSWNNDSILFAFNSSGNGIGYNTGPTPTLMLNHDHNGVPSCTLYRAIEAFSPPYHWGTNFSAVLIYATLNGTTCNMNDSNVNKNDEKQGSSNYNLLNPNIWKMTNRLEFSQEWVPTTIFSKGVTDAAILEGNAVLGQDGIVRNVLRFDGTDIASGNRILNYAIVTRFNQSQNELEFDKFIQMPGGHTKFVIYYDFYSGKYISLTNNATCTDGCSDQRNLLTLISSNDLYNWDVNQLLLWDDTGMQGTTASYEYTGFQYVDWRFDGVEDENIIYLIRTSYRGANTYHNANRITYKVLYNWRQYL